VLLRPLWAPGPRSASLRPLRPLRPVPSITALSHVTVKQGLLTMRVLLWLFFPRSVRGQETRSVPPSSRHMAHEFTFVTSSPAILFAFGLGVRPLGRKRPLGLFATLCPPVARRRDDGSITPSAARQPSYDSTKPTQLLQTPALIVSRRGHVGPCGMLDHRPMRRARYSANLRAAGQVLLGASVLIGARGLLA
jgi:hypothetical protein